MNEGKYVFLAPKNGDIGLKHAKNVKQNNHFFITYQAKVFGLCECTAKPSTCINYSREPNTLAW